MAQHSDLYAELKMLGGAEKQRVRGYVEALIASRGGGAITAEGIEHARGVSDGLGRAVTPGERIEVGA